MATHTLVPQAQTQTKQREIGFAQQKHIVHKVVSQSAAQCGASCPICQQEGGDGICMLEAGHSQDHQCNRVSSHRWSGPPAPEIPGPH